MSRLTQHSTASSYSYDGLVKGVLTLVCGEIFHPRSTCTGIVVCKGRGSALRARGRARRETTFHRPLATS